ncbi:hypothetical protein SDC9_207394 [bioreactor metagenome]|uniref:Uncharacterized protein n=1 Tax=bioreactor metagenome TaxID=1076179 RepID=A0A645J983_9ZZZZ
MHVRLFQFGAVVKHLDIPFKPAIIEKRARFLAGDPNLVTTIEKIEREILGELILPLILRVHQVLADIFCVEGPNQRHMALVRNAHRLIPGGTGAVRMHNVKRVRVDPREIVHIQRGGGRLQLRAAGQA